MPFTYEVRAGEELTVIFSLIDTNGVLVTGQAAGVVVELRDQEGAAAETVVVQEQGASGYYEARFTPAKSSPGGYSYLLALTGPSATTDGSRLENTIRVFPTGTFLGTSGPSLTSLANVKLYLGITDSSADDVLNLIIPRVSRMVESVVNRRIAQVPVTEYVDGTGRQELPTRWAPISAVTVRYSEERDWTVAPVDSTDYFVDTEAGILARGSGGVWLRGNPRNHRLDYTAGYAVIPADDEWVAILASARAYKEKDHLLFQSRSLKDGSVSVSVNQLRLRKLVGDIAPRRSIRL